MAGGHRLHRSAAGLAAVLCAVLAICGLLAARNGLSGRLPLATALVAAWSLWPLSWCFERPRLWRFQAEGPARTAAIVLGCATAVAWTAVVTTSDSSTAALGFVWSPLLVLGVVLSTYAVLRGTRLSPAPPPEGSSPARR